jgi:hypothetical protein
LFRSQQVFGEPFQHLLPQHELIHDDSLASRTDGGHKRGGQVPIVKGSTSLGRLLAVGGPEALA